MARLVWRLRLGERLGSEGALAVGQTYGGAARRDLAGPECCISHVEGV
jgi:hypothetical protein